MVKDNSDNERKNSLWCMQAIGILPLDIPLFVIQFTTTQVKVWRTLNHLPVTQIKNGMIPHCLYGMTNERLIIIYSFWCKYAMTCYSTIIYTQMSQKLLIEYTSRGALAGTRNSSMDPPHEGSIRRPIAP